MPTKFQRNYELLVQGNDGNLYAFAYPLTLEFYIKRNYLPYSANSGNFKIYNLGQQHRNVIYKAAFSQFSSFRSLTLKAGYGVGQARNLPVVFQGNVMTAQSYRMEKSVNFITEIDGYDYGWVITNATSSVNYPANTVSKTTIINNFIGDLKSVLPSDPIAPNAPLGTGYISPQYSPVQSNGKPLLYDKNYSFVGNTWDGLQQITNNQTYIDNGNVYSLFDNDVYNGNVTIINSQTGLLGTPKVQGQLIIIEMLFEPGLQIGQQIQIQSTALLQYPINNNGYFKVVGVEHRGTISGAVGGECKTIVSCLLPLEKLNLISGNT